MRKPLEASDERAPIRSIRARRPDLPQVACFDTAFHRDHGELADRYAIPEELYQAGVRHYGGWHTAALMMRIYTENYSSRSQISVRPVATNWSISPYFPAMNWRYAQQSWKPAAPNPALTAA